MACTVPEVEDVREVLTALPWRRLDPVPDYYLTVVRARAEVIRPHVFIAPGDEGVATAFVGRVEDVPLASTVGYRSIYRPTVRAIVLAHGGLLGTETRDGAEVVLDHLRGALARGEAEVALLPRLRTDSALYTLASSLRFPVRQPFAPATMHWDLRLPDSFDQFLGSRSKSTRENVKRYRNRLRREFGDALKVKIFREPEDADVLFRDAGSIAAKTYQHGLGVAFADTELDRSLTRLGLERGWFRAYVLYVGDEPVAFWPGAVYEGTFFSGTPGYDPRFAEYGIGKYVLMHVIEDLCAEDGVDTVDYGFGEADYKRQFGSESWKEADVAIFAPRLRPLRINVTRTVLESGIGLAKAAATRAGFADRLRRRWRRRLAQPNRATGD